MKRNDNILNELDAIGSEYLYTFIQCPFVVNDAYFQNLPLQLMGDIKLIDNYTEPSIYVNDLKLSNSSNLWLVPERYFEHFADTVMARISSLDEIDDDIYAVLPASKHPYVVEESYFESNLAQLLIQVGAEEPAELSPMLEDLRNKNPFETPNSYFGSIELQIPAPEAQINDDINTLEFKPKSKSKTAKTWLVAASVLLMVSFGVNRFLDMEQDVVSPEQKINTLLASISDRSIDEYIDYNLDEFELTSMNNTTTIQNQLLNAISNSEIDAYLDLMN